MTVEIISACPKLRGKVVRGALERCVFAAIGLSLAATSIGALGEVATPLLRIRRHPEDRWCRRPDRCAEPQAYMLPETIAKAF
jgi:hypothetical protein